MLHHLACVRHVRDALAYIVAGIIVEISCRAYLSIQCTVRSRCGKPGRCVVGLDFIFGVLMHPALAFDMGWLVST